MHIAVVGTGYVGLVTGTCFSEMGNDVYCVDVDEKKIAALNKGQIPIYEPGLSSMVEEHLKNGTLHFTTDIKEALAKCNARFIAARTAAYLYYNILVVIWVVREQKKLQFVKEALAFLL